MPSIPNTPDRDCQLCPRLSAFREENRQLYPDKFNAPVPCFGPMEAQIMIIGLAPGLRGANFTGRPFTGDYAGDLLYQSLIKFGLARGEYKADPNDGLTLVNCRIMNAVRCLPPENKPTSSEINTCRPFLLSEMQAMPRVKVAFCLGKIAHDSMIRTLGERVAAMPFGHGTSYPTQSGIQVISSYHCSRYNTNTGRLTTQMFEDVVEQCVRALD